MKQQNNIRIIFTDKANIIIEEIITKFKLEETPEEMVEKSKNNKSANIVILDRTAKDFALGKITEQEMLNILQKELNVSAQISQEISKEIINNIIPLLQKVTEDKLNDPDFINDFANKFFGEKNTITNLSTQSNKNEPSPLDDIIASGNNEIKNNIESTTENASTPARRGRKPLPKAPITPEQPMQTTPQSSGPDKYREPIE